MDVGLMPYRQALDLQLQLHAQRLSGRCPDTVVVCEHPSVVTLGVKGPANRLTVAPGLLATRGIDLVQTDRGGGVTAHNPGQLVFYPIIDLRARGLAVSDYIRQLETIGIVLLARLGLKAQTRKGLPGVWIGDRKIGFIGVRIRHGVTLHGMAINIANDLGIFDLFVPCGIDGLQVTSVQRELGRNIQMGQARDLLMQAIEQAWADGRPARKRLPEWLRRPAPTGRLYERTEQVLVDLGLETVCMHANCPNRGQCWARGTATILILGPICTRRCRFCSVATGRPSQPDPTEPMRVAEMAARLGLRYLVITSVDRDDLPDGGASQFRDCVVEVRKRMGPINVELLVPDFKGCQERALEVLRPALPFVFAHNLETVPELYPKVRPGADYKRSLALLRMAKERFGVQTKSSIMLGLGETDSQVERVLMDLRAVGCDRLTIGQYLRPSKESLEVVEYVRPEVFEAWRVRGLSMGFSWVLSGPFARSSYMADSA